MIGTRRGSQRHGSKWSATAAAVTVVVGVLTGPLAWGSASAVRPHSAHPRCAPAAPARAPKGGPGAQWAHRVPSGGCRPETRSDGGTPPSPAYNGSPPLVFHGGAVTGTTIPGELTVTPVYWVPAGGGFAIPTAYKNLVNRFIADAASDSGADTNAFSVVKQYTKSGGAHLQYRIHAGAPIVDTDAFPGSGCTPDSGAIWAPSTGYSVCLTNSQMLGEASGFTSVHGLPNNDLAHLYMYFLPKGVENCFTSVNGAAGGTCSINGSRSGSFCGYHAFGSPPLVAVMDYAFVDSPTGWTCSSDAGSNTGGNQTPNSNIDADTEISVTSHEIIETITDPQGTAWYDASGSELSDDCSYVYGDSNTFVGAAGKLYNQTIHGHHYFIQEEFSNDDFAAVPALSCIQSEDVVKVSPASGPAGTSVTISGSGFATGESVTVSYSTGKPSPKTVVVCTATASATGVIGCSGRIPAAAKAGAKGKHTLTAKGATSQRKPTARFTLN